MPPKSQITDAQVIFKGKLVKGSCWNVDGKEVRKLVEEVAMNLRPNLRVQTYSYYTLLSAQSIASLGANMARNKYSSSKCSCQHILNLCGRAASASALAR